MVLGPVDEVGHDQEVAGETHAHDHVQFQIQARAVAGFVVACRQRSLQQALVQAGVRLAADPAVQGFLAGYRIRRQRVLAQGEFQIAALRQGIGVVDGVGHIGEQRGHFLRRFKILLGAVLARALGVVEHAPGGNAHARFVRIEAVAAQEAHIVAGDDRQSARRRGVQREGVERVLAVALGAGQFKVQVVAEAALQVGQVLFGVFVATARGQAPGVAVAAGDGEQAFAAVAQPLRRDRHTVRVVAFHPGARQQPRQRQVAGMVAAQQGQLPRTLLAIDEAEVGADDGLDADRFGGLVELDQREQVIAVGHRQRRQAHFHRAAQQVGPLGFFRASFVRFLGHADGGIRQREFGVQVQMDETRSHAGPGWCRSRLSASSGWGKA